MKKTTEYLEKLYITQDGEPKSVHDSVENILDAFKQIQIDAIEETCRVCADELYTKQIPYFDGTDLEKTNCSEIWEEDCFVPSYLSVVDKQSILSVADKLKKELEWDN